MPGLSWGSHGSCKFFDVLRRVERSTKSSVKGGDVQRLDEMSKKSWFGRGGDKEADRSGGSLNEEKEERR